MFSKAKGKPRGQRMNDLAEHNSNCPFLESLVCNCGAIDLDIAYSNIHKYGLDQQAKGKRR